MILLGINLIRLKIKLQFTVDSILVINRKNEFFSLIDTKKDPFLEKKIFSIKYLLFNSRFLLYLVKINLMHAKTIFLCLSIKKI